MFQKLSAIELKHFIWCRLGKKPKSWKQNKKNAEAAARGEECTIKIAYDLRHVKPKLTAPARRVIEVPVRPLVDNLVHMIDAHMSGEAE